MNIIVIFKTFHFNLFIQFLTEFLYNIWILAFYICILKLYVPSKKFVMETIRYKNHKICKKFSSCKFNIAMFFIYDNFLS